MRRWWNGQEEQDREDLFAHPQHGFGNYTPAGVALGLWYDWVEDATFEVVVHR